MTGTDSSVRVFFEPKSVAVVGASRAPGKVGNTILKNLVSLKYPGQIFPVNPGAREILGLPAYASVAAIPHEIELAVIALPAHLVLDIAKECAVKKVKGLVIISSGFEDIGGEGSKRQRELIRVARSAGMRIIGPNTTGILNPYLPFTSTFVDLGEVRAGSVAFISQTGMFAGLMLQRILTAETFGLSKVAGLGNKSDIADHDILEYLAQDQATRAIMMYVEGIKDGRRFLTATRRISKEKPIVILKIGRTRAGAKAARSHTGSLTGRDDVFDAVCRQAGIIRANNFEELVDSAKIFAFQPIPRGNRIAIITLSMGAGALASDFCSGNGFELAELDRQSLQRIKEKLPDWVKLGNPVDIEMPVELLGAEEGYKLAFDAVLSDKNVDLCLVVIGTVLTPEHDIQFLEQIKNKYPEKPVAACIIGKKETYDQLFPIIEGFKIPVFPSVHRAVNGLAALKRYRELNDGEILH